jgi:predicted ferric reductase
MKKSVFYIFVTFILVVTYTLWIYFVADVGALYTEPYRAFSRIFALFGTVLFSFAMVLSTRLSIIEDWLGGLDTVYGAHHVLGSLAFVFILLHPILLAFQALPVFHNTLPYFFPVGTTPQIFGVLAVYALLISFFFMLFIKVSYRWWILSHRMLYISFIFSTAHILFLSSDISVSFVLRLWILFFVFIGLVSGFYMLFLYAKFGPRYQYRVSYVRVDGDVVNLLLTPVRKPLVYFPGQFVFVQFHSRGMRSERHPFSIASISEEAELRLVVRMKGDFTQNISTVLSGDMVSVYGPYGRFGSIFLKTQKDIVWVAGGIGITPFLSMLHYEAVHHHAHRRIYFLYTYRSENDPFLSEIETTLQFTPQVRFVPWPSAVRGHVTAQSLADAMGRDFTDCYIFLCGPAAMMERMHDDLVGLNVHREKIIFENFLLG